jgi:DNA-binding NarL/FixJ family response regulator
MLGNITTLFRALRPSRRGPPPPTPRRVLLSYGDEDVSRWLVNLLRRMDGLVCQETDGEWAEVERAAFRLAPHLILLDARRIDSRSVNLVRRLKRRLPETKVYLLGLDEGLGYNSSAQRAGADGYVSTDRVVESLEMILGPDNQA